VRAAKPGDTVTFALVRAGERREASVTLAAWDPKHMVNPLGRQDPVPPAMAAGPAPPAQPGAPAAAPVDAQAAELKEQVAKLKAQVAELDRQLQAEDAVRRAVRPQPAPQPSAK
jgi:hypothetical protein